MMSISAQALNNWFNRGVPGSAISMVTALFWLNRMWLEHGVGEPDVAGSPWLPEKSARNATIGEHHIGEPLSVWDDTTPLDEDEVYVPFLKEVELSAGQGVTAVQPEVTQKLRFGKSTLRRQNVQPDEAVCVTVSGDSMEPVLPHGSTVGINTGSTSIVDGKMYAIDHAGHLRVKTLYRLPGGGIRIRSFNREDHPDEEYTADQMEKNEITVLGKVFWSSVLW
ncbi:MULTISPECIES: S24 family peptidase [Pseudomonas]|uniref:S24 family peptidase n=1 Tax=Pseudomonas TaxID=286 RepID=UPI00257EBF1F|nr:MULTISPECIES: helix-turn-helix transcriptional regulator [Pseudomonas]